LKFGVVVFPGSNCERDCYYIADEVLKKETSYLWHKDRDLKDSDVIIIPGGFSYGDYLRAGGIARFSPIMEEIVDFAKKGGIIIGICNGFQVLVESGLLPGALMLNKNLKFICDTVNLKIENDSSVFTNQYKKGEVVRIPIAHKEGNYFAEENIVKQLEDQDRIALRYCDSNGNVTDEANPNGSVGNIAGVLSVNKRVLGLMPHPERMAEEILGGNDGIKVFHSILEGVV